MSVSFLFFLLRNGLSCDALHIQGCTVSSLLCQDAHTTPSGSFFTTEKEARLSVYLAAPSD
jgi:hypothetical protein